MWVRCCVRGCSNPICRALDYPGLCYHHAPGSERFKRGVIRLNKVMRRWHETLVYRVWDVAFNDDIPEAIHKGIDWTFGLLNTPIRPRAIWRWLNQPL